MSVWIWVRLKRSTDRAVPRVGTVGVRSQRPGEEGKTRQGREGCKERKLWKNETKTLKQGNFCTSGRSGMGCLTRTETTLD